METKQELLTLNGKEYLLDIEKAKELGLLKEKDTRAKSWAEFVTKQIGKRGYAYNIAHDIMTYPETPVYTADQLTPHEAKALAAFSKLLKLRRDWIGEWEPDWSNKSEYRYCICNGFKTLDVIGLTVDSFVYLTKPLSFPTQQMAQEFLETFRDLIEEAKILI